jgi:N6-L-threonylcarbamoyladenine synthase
MKILGIETSCDETAAAVVEDGRRLLSNVVLSSLDLHAAYGGVVPEIAARSHIEAINPVVAEALQTAGCDWDGIDGIAVTYGAGLGGSLLIGVLTARTLALVKKKPLYAINHVEGHVYANFLTSAGPRSPASGQSPDLRERGPANVQEWQLGDLTYTLPTKPPSFPMLALIVSGGHSQLVLFRDHFDYTLLGQTQDDAIGEAFDKVAKLLGLPYPGGPSIGKKALEGNAFAFNLPKAKMGPRSTRGLYSDGVQGGSEDRKGAPTIRRDSANRSDNAAIHAVVASGKYDFSFSGLKTAVLRLAQAQAGKDYTFPSTELAGALSEAQKADIAASFQCVAIETVVDKTVMAFEEFRPASVVIGGGVAASPELRRQLAERLPYPIDYTDPKLCTDNGAMIATLGCFTALHGKPPADPYSLDIEPNLSM